jgi:predicted nucleic acid-binding protein
VVRLGFADVASVVAGAETLALGVELKAELVLFDERSVRENYLGG